MTLANGIEALEARIGPRAKRCVIFTMKCPDPERYEQVIADVSNIKHYGYWVW